jgi:hypothetical protein
MSDKHFTLCAFALSIIVLTLEGVQLFAWDGSFNGLDLLVVILAGAMSARCYKHICDSWY